MPGSGGFPWRKKCWPTPTFLPGESHGQRSLVGYSPWGPKSWTQPRRMHIHCRHISLYPDDWHTTKGKKKCGHGAQPASPCLALRAAVNLLSLGFARPLSLPVNSHLHQKLESVHCSVMSNSAIPWFVACQAPLSMEVSRQEYWNLLPFPTPGDLPNPGITAVSLVSPALQADSLLSES